jgi:hypothetical protein
MALVVGAVLLVFAVRRRSAEARGDNGDLYRCHVEEDSACTIVRQTPRGLVVVSYRPQAAAVNTGEGWSVLVTDAAGVTESVRPGTVTIVPAGPRGQGAASPGERTSPPPFPALPPTFGRSGLANSAPIIE